MDDSEEELITTVDADRADAKVEAMAAFGWALAARADAPWSGGLCVERALPGDADPVGAPKAVARLCFRRRLALRVRERVRAAEAAYWDPEPRSPGFHVALAVLDWVAGVALLLAIGHAGFALIPGPSELLPIVRVGALVPTVVLALLAWVAVRVGRSWSVRRAADPAWRRVHLARRRLRARAVADRLLGRDVTAGLRPADGAPAG